MSDGYTYTTIGRYLTGSSHEDDPHLSTFIIIRDGIETSTAKNDDRVTWGICKGGFGEKTVKTEHGELAIKVPRDREATFDPQVLPKRSKLSEGIEKLVVSLYAKGMSNADIEEQLRELYDFRLPTSTISTITARVSEDVLAWQNRPLDPLYMIQ